MFAAALLGQRPSGEVVVALAVIAAGVVIVTFRGRIADLQLRPALMAFAAASVFGVGLVASSQAGRSIGPFWTILIARIVGVAIVVVPLLLSRRLPLPGLALWMVVSPASPRWPASSGTSRRAGTAWPSPPSWRRSSRPWRRSARSCSSASD